MIMILRQTNFSSAHLLCAHFNISDMSVELCWTVSNDQLNPGRLNDIDVLSRSHDLRPRDLKGVLTR